MKEMPGYTGRIGRVDLSTGTVTRVSTEEYAPDFIGGQGMATKIYWDEVGPQVQAFAPENRLIFANGPCAGFKGLAGARWVVCGKSPATTPSFFTHSNLGGDWGAELKFAGFDGLVVQGRADKPIYLMIEDDKIRIRDAAGIWGKGAVQVREILKSELGSAFKVVATGQAGENMTALATLLADHDATGTGSLGGVMGSKKLKAIAVRGSGNVSAAQPERLQKLLDHIAGLTKDSPQTDLSDKDGIQQGHCYGCVDVCNRGVYESPKWGTRKFMCQSSGFYKRYAGNQDDRPKDVHIYATRLCDDYGLNTKSIESMIAWLKSCYEEGILTEQQTRLPLGKIGGQEFIEALTSSIAHCRDFGETLAKGLPRAAEEVGDRAVELLYDRVTKAGEKLTYSPKAFISHGLLYAVEYRQPIQQLHELSRLSINWVRWAGGEPQANLSSTVFRAIAKRFWGSELAVDFSTYEGKALAAKMIQDREFVKDSLILCDSAWPISYVEHSPDHVGDPTLESKVFSAITGREMTEDNLYRIGERIFNLQRAVLAREGHRGRESDTLPEAVYTVPLQTERLNPECLFPGKDGEIISRNEAVYDRDKFQEMLGEFYELRGWDPETGLQKKDTLKGLGLGEVARDLEERDLLGEDPNKIP